MMESNTQSQVIANGMKSTEIGLIPNDWTVLTLNECTTKVGSGKTPTGGANVYVDSGRPFIRSQNVQWGRLELSDVVYITEQVHKTFVGSELKENDVLLNITGASIGRCTLADSRISGGNVNQHVCIIRTNNKILVPKLLVELINSSLGQVQIDSNQAGGNREGLNFAQVRQLQFAVPQNIIEQTAIANTLSDVDALICELGKLIAKKQAIKTATMQQLLTGKTRLPQFATYPEGAVEGKSQGQPKGTKPSELGEIPEDWDVANIGSQCTIFGRIGFRGYTKEDIVGEEDGVISLSPSNIKNGKLTYNNCTYITWEKYEESPEIKIYNNDILLVKTGSTFGKVGIVKNLPKEATLNPQVVVLKKLKCHYGFLAAMMGFNIVQDQINESIVGGAIPTLSQKEVSNFLIPLPTIAEQTAISSILSDMDDEIQTLEQRLAKTRQIKQGMMQELLTGKTRLVKPESK